MRPTSLPLFCILLALIVNGRASYVSFPLRNVMSSVQVGTASTNEPFLPTGKCEDVSDGRVIITVSNFGLRDLYVGVIESVLASCLSLRENLIDHIGIGTFDRLPNLSFLDLSKNRIPFCDTLSFGGHPMLKTLIVDENEPPGEDVSRSITQADIFPRLEHLYLRKNALRGLDLSVRRSFPVLTHLYMSDNFVQSEDFLRDFPVTLTHLHLERNRVYRFGGAILRNLHSLFLDGNAIANICRRTCYGSSLDLQGAQRLQFLSLSKNNLETIERDAFREACELATLNLSHNRIQVIRPGTFDDLTMLKDLSLSHNRLTVVPDLTRSILLTSLSLSHNEIQTVNVGALDCLTLLKWLSLGSNKIYRIDVAGLNNLSFLEELDLSDNELDRLPARWMSPQTSLKRLDVKGNRFSSLQDLHLEGAPFLTHIYMQNNFVKQIGARDFVGLGLDAMVFLENECKPPTRRARETLLRSSGA